MSAYPHTYQHIVVQWFLFHTSMKGISLARNIYLPYFQVLTNTKSQKLQNLKLELGVTRNMGVIAFTIDKHGIQVASEVP